MKPQPLRWECPHGCRPGGDPCQPVTGVTLHVTPSSPPVHSCRKQNWRTVALVPITPATPPEDQ